jgi:hypothetical protein
VAEQYSDSKDDVVLPSRCESFKTARVQGIGGVTGKALALSLVAGAVYGVVKLVDLVTD